MRLLSGLLEKFVKKGTLRLYDASGRLIRPVTSGDWEARTVHHVDAKGGWVYVSGTRDSSIADTVRSGTL